MLHVVVCEIWGCCGVREERLGGGGGGEMLFESRPWYGKWKIGRPPEYIKGQIGGFVLHKFYHGCRPYDFC